MSDTPTTRTCLSGASATFVRRFWAKVDKSAGPDGCWLWTAAKAEFGYGVIGLGGRGTGLIRAHRASWELAHGAIPDGMFLLHRCDVPACVNPAHLFLGTLADNAHDAIAKGRAVDPPRNPHLRGERHYRAKLTEKIVGDIKARARAGERQVDIARAVGVSKDYVCKIVAGQKWRHVA